MPAEQESEQDRKRGCLLPVYVEDTFSRLDHVIAVCKKSWRVDPGNVTGTLTGRIFSHSMRDSEHEMAI